MADISLLFDWLALLAIGLMSITIPTYAISVSFLGRERKRTLFELERRREDLEKKMGELSSKVTTDPGLAALEAEIKQYKKDIENIKGNLGSLSVYGAFVLPFICFAFALFATGYGFATFESVFGPSSLALTADAWGLFSITFLGLGIFLLGRSLIRVNQAALSPESLSAFRVTLRHNGNGCRDA